MPVVDVMNLEGKKVGQVALADAVFSAKVNPHLLHETVRWYLAGQRAGTHKTKGRGEVSGAGRKLWKQKGTGRARVGSIRSSLWRKGGTVHGPQPRDYSYRLPHKVVLGALRSALSAKLAEQKLTVIDGWELDSHKTKALRLSLGRLGKDARTALLVVHGENRNLDLASRNLEGVKLVRPAALQAYDLLRHDHLIVSKDVAVRLGTTLAAVRPEPAELIETIAPAPAIERPEAPAKKKAAAARKTSGGKKTPGKKKAAPKSGKKKEKE
ncbi:MAG TPA: 50S ribosomal protein L4 [Candidatus Dormibacteraeota bacterium]|nr:50S ribosomal protein L4 [Candidatus Dormibacteraeota bacterium]